MFMSNVRSSGTGNAIATPPLRGCAPPAQSKHSTTHLSAYVGADPVNNVDPLGLITWAQCIADRNAAIATASSTGVVCGGGPGGAGGGTGGQFGGLPGEPGLERGSLLQRGIHVKIGPLPPPSKTKKLSQCIQDFMKKSFLGYDWSKITVSSAEPLPNAWATNWGTTINAGSSFGNFEGDKGKLFHELAHSPQWAAGELTRSGYIGSSIMAGLRSLGQARMGRGFQSFAEMHRSIPIEQAADQISDVLQEAYEQAGKPCE